MPFNKLNSFLINKLFLVVLPDIPKHFGVKFTEMARKPPAFGQVVIGPPGSGKTTYCSGMLQFLTGIGRKVAVVNMDPANDTLPYECKVDISDLVTLKEVQYACIGKIQIPFCRNEMKNSKL